MDARRKIQEAGKLYRGGHLDKACPMYDQVLEITGAREVKETAHYNAGICYHKMFRPGVETPENKANADKATQHFVAYLELHPQDRAIVGMMSQVWMDSGNYAAALQYWERELAKNPKDTEVILILAGIHRQSGDWEKAIEWHFKEVEAMDTPQGKAGGYMNVAKLTSAKLFNRDSVYWDERVRIADMGIAALQQAEALTPDDPDIAQYMGTMFNLRAEAHQAAWAQVIDSNTGRYYFKRYVRLRDAQDPNKGKPANGTGATPTTTTPTPTTDGAGATPTTTTPTTTPPTDDGAGAATTPEPATTTPAAPPAPADNP